MASIDIDIGTFDLSSANNVSVGDIDVRVLKSLKRGDLAKLDGSVIPDARRREIRIGVRGKVSGADYTALRSNMDALKAALESTSEQKFTLDDDRFIMVRYDGVDFGWENFRTVATFRFNLLAGYPFWLSETRNSDTRSPASATGYALTNNGNARARVKVTITNNSGGDVTDDIRFENTTTGERFEYGGTLANGDSLVIDNKLDVEDFSVLNDGSDDMANFHGDRLHADPGSNTFKLTSTAAPNLSVTVAFPDGWL